MDVVSSGTFDRMLLEFYKIILNLKTTINHCVRKVILSETPFNDNTLCNFSKFELRIILKQTKIGHTIS